MRISCRPLDTAVATLLRTQSLSSLLKADRRREISGDDQEMSGDGLEVTVGPAASHSPGTC